MTNLNGHGAENGEDRGLDSTSALEKVLRLDRKHTNFDYSDPLRKYQSFTFIFLFP
jgi:hypothetical protein